MWGESSLTKVTLVYPPYHFKPPVWPFSRPTLVLAHLYAVLEEAGLGAIEALDLDLEFDDCEESVDHYLARAGELVERTDPDVVCISCKAAQFPFSTLFVRRYKQSHPKAKIVMGGWMPTLAPETTLHLSKCDAVVRGEGERSLPALIRGIDRDEWDIDGVSYPAPRTQGKIIHNPNVKALTQAELDDLPLPRYDTLPPLERYQPGRVKPCFSVQASRGCTNHSCIFCWNSTKNCDTSWRARPPTRVVEEIRHLVDRYGAQVIFFADDSFGAEERWLKTFIAEMRNEFTPGQVEYVASMRVDTVKREMLKGLYESGMRTIFHGIESGSPRCWTSLGKNLKPHITQQHILNLIEWETENRISPVCSFIVSFPGETEEDLDQTIYLCEELANRGSLFSLQILAPNEGTALYDVQQYRKVIEPCDLYKEFGESENLSPETRAVLGDKLTEFIEYLPEFRRARSSIPLHQLKQKYARLGEICSYEGLLKRKFRVSTLSRDGRHAEPVRQRESTILNAVKRLRRLFK
jgi:anaerobic magnesium-protoporphyrin IX monomethyl ester cyclase